MANARTTDWEATILEQTARGRRTRYCYSVPLIAAEDRAAIDTDSHILADAIKNTAVNKGIFIAPCKGKIVRVTANALAFAECAAGGTITAQCKKAVIGGTDVALNTAITVSGESGSVPTAETAIDGTLSSTAGALDVIQGQLVYVVLTVSNHTVDVRTDGMTVEIEFVPTDAK